MHLSEGILSAPVVLATLGVAALATAWSVRNLSEQAIPLAAILGCVFLHLARFIFPSGLEAFICC
ncbi:energy-coupling factor ABC transporter permease [Paenalcaligenes niemegkensis]|nr:energy-coupling factor ABC transporter permease [Paenalcaligenes niemegkensis]MCQ9617579.1 energy-coupling factor ABC transporter permease [Paenalcaligenes niemegkensis]